MENGGASFSSNGSGAGTGAVACFATGTIGAGAGFCRVGNGTSNSGSSHCAAATATVDVSFLIAGAIAAGGDAARAALGGMLGGTTNSGVGHAMSMEISGTSALTLGALRVAGALCGAAFCGAAFCAAFSAAATAASSASTGAGCCAAIFCETDFSITRSAGFVRLGPVLGFGLHAADDAQIGGTRGGGQRARIGIANFRKDGIGFVFRK